MNRRLVLGGVLGYSVLVGVLRHLRLIGATGTAVLFGIMVVDLAATHWLLRRTARRR